MAAEDALHLSRIKPLENGADGGVRWRAAPFQPEGVVELAGLDIDGGGNAAIAIAAGHDGKDREQRHMRQLVELALRSARIRNLGQQIEQRRECNHGNLRDGWCSRSQRFGDPAPLGRMHFTRRCCRSDSGQTVRQS